MKNKDALINLTKEIENPDHADEELNVQLFMHILREEVSSQFLDFWLPNVAGLATRTDFPVCY